MFKSIFVKYISAFMVIIIFSIFLSTSIITTLVSIYDGNNKNRALTNVAFKVENFLVNDYEKSDNDNFEEYIHEEQNGILTIFNAMSANLNDIVIFLADEDGILRIAGGSDYSEEFADKGGMLTKELRYSDEIEKEMTEGNTMLRNDTLDGLFSEKRRAYIRPIQTREGIVGSVMTCSMDSAMDELLEKMIKTIVVTTLWLMLASLVAVYFITEHLVAPLKQMGKAAREFASGHFDARVVVTGDDEVAQLAEAFNVMATNLQNSDETRRLFLANVSHDLRTPMTTIAGFIDSILSGAIPQDQVPHYLEVISGEIRRLSRLVSSLLDITKIQAGERKFTMAPFDICELGRQIIIANEQRLEDKHLDVIFDADEDNIFVNGDRDAIHQVFYNICDNGIKYARDGGKFSVSIHNMSAGKIEISVFNEGEGITPKDLQFIFDRFYKTDLSRGLDKNGSGLGLYISKTIIEAHNEHIKAESEYGKWCRFTFTMQRIDAPRLKG